MGLDDFVAGLRKGAWVEDVLSGIRARDARAVHGDDMDPDHMQAITDRSDLLDYIDSRRDVTPFSSILESNASRARSEVAQAMTKYLEGGTGDFTMLAEYLPEPDYAYAEGWADFHDALCDFEDLIVARITNLPDQPIDIERLARAMHTWCGDPKCGGWDDCPDRILFMEEARDIEAAYEGVTR